MATETVKNVVMPLSQLGLLNLNSSGDMYYSIRYRIISEDRSRYSAWSPIYDIKFEPTYIHPTINGNKSNNVVTATWTTPIGLETIPEFDVYKTTATSPTDADWEYVGSTPNVNGNNSFVYIQKDESITYIAVQIATKKKAVFSSKPVFLNKNTEWTITALDTTNIDGGTA